ncbi:hypothetical protein ELI54_34405 [Rhizobium ruizarguesonis]|uniref:hypothetical protein n=1 Tax=Rhizobium TaxID=379 RepID=UPI00102FD66F|nr:MULTISPECIES: hypothetical protein [Rhizobium]TCA20338.1 hypothetical protein E0H70_32315 [Rhizobium leguminosarum bv. viciae]NEI05377.1 hypothetical protein [Rhizobium ruizarguesonis]NEI11091.1 hypothetical protein [Rhizobium ruizarguesonis]NEI59387.1 hypothetical protein [Rhizobium leguminosarum]NEI88227.1 hypothetical protein [Rhizobium leguminosarum]
MKIVDLREQSRHLARRQQQAGADAVCDRVFGGDHASVDKFFAWYCRAPIAIPYDNNKSIAGYGRSRPSSGETVQAGTRVMLYAWRKKVLRLQLRDRFSVLYI